MQFLQDVWSHWGGMQEEATTKNRMKANYKTEPQSLAPSQPHTDEEGFVTVRKKAAALVTRHKELSVPTNAQNYFDSLAETEGPENMHLRTEGARPTMDRICSWNIRGLNQTNKQEDVKIFLHENQIGFIGLLETKVKENKAEKIGNNIFQGWN